jgi:hypothetical protein
VRRLVVMQRGGRAAVAKVVRVEVVGGCEARQARARPTFAVTAATGTCGSAVVHRCVVVIAALCWHEAPAPRRGREDERNEQRWRRGGD